MHLLACLALCAALGTTSLAHADDIAPPVNPAIDMGAYLRVSIDAAAQRDSHRLPEDAFIEMSGEPGTIVLDARSAAMYAKLHVKGAINLPFPDLASASLAAAIPDRATRILIYCNNNFRNAEDAFPSKLPAASLNLSTFIALYTYGYRNVYELAPLLDVRDTRLVFEGSDEKRELRAALVD